MAACEAPVLCTTNQPGPYDFVRDQTRVRCDTCGWSQGVENERFRALEPPVTEWHLVYYLHGCAPAMPQRWEGDDG